MAEFSSLSTEVIKIILLQLVPPNIFPLCCLNKMLNDICSDDIFWLDVAKKYFPKESRYTSTWKSLVKNLSTPEIIAVRSENKYESQEQFPFARLSLNKFSTVKDLWMICKRLNKELFLHQSGPLSDQLIKNYPLSSDEVYFKLFFNTDDGLEWHNLQIQETGDSQKFIVISYNSNLIITLNDDYLFNITLDKLWVNKFKTALPGTLLKALFDFVILSP